MKEKLYRFMQGRYGTDKLNQFIFYCELFLLVLSLFFKRNIIIYILFYCTLVLYMYRAFSKNYVARSIENQKFIRMRAKVLHRLQAIYKNLTINYICLFDYLFISSQMSAKPYFIGSTGILLLW